MATSYRTFNYMLDFGCLGGECEDTCCKSWDIRIDKFHFQLMQEKVGESGEAETVRFNEYVKLNEDESASEQNYAYINLKEDGFCPFLETDGWCNLHRTYGEAPLSNVCAYYPRVLSLCGDVVELSGAMSCPEMVRKCLFDDRQFELVDFKTDILPRPDDYPLTRELTLPADDVYYDNFVKVRSVLLQLATMEGFGFESRLYFLASFANRLGAFYFHECELPEPKRLISELTHALNIGTLEKLDDYVSKYIPAEPVAIIVVQSVLQLRMQQFPNEYTSKLASEIFASYAGNVVNLNADDLQNALPPEPLWEQFQLRKSAVNSCFQAELDEYLSRFVVNCLYREWFITMPDLFTYLHMLTIRLSILRFLLYSHPGINQLADELLAKNNKADAKTIEALKKMVVEVVYNYSRAIDHNMPFLMVVYDAINEQQMMTFDYSLPFIKY